MAARATHRTANLQSAPSIFEIIAQDSLRSSIYPALKRLVEYVTANKESRSIQDWYDEIYLAINGLLQYHYLRHEDASFSEAFYGLQRVTSNNLSLTTKQRLLSLIPLALIPYLKIKLENIAMRYKIEDLDGLLQNDKKSELKRTLYQIEPVTPLIWHFLKLVQYFSYISGTSAYSSPELSLLRLKLMRTDNKRFVIGWSELWSSLKNFQAWETDKLMEICSQGLFRSIEIGAFFIQFLQWWYSENTISDYTSIPVPTPPPVDEKGEQFKGVCPICLQRWKIPTILPASGYVFCYRCVVRHLKLDPKCPITHYPTKVEELVRLYDD